MQKIALIYDFDKTLCTKDMQEYGFIPKINMNSKEFWDNVKKLTDVEKMDSVLSYMYEMMNKAKEKNIKITRSDFNELGKEIEYFKGVDTWFDRINNYCLNNSIDVEHYIISSGVKEIIEGTSIAKYFKKIYACEFMYDNLGNIIWPKLAINYTEKTQFLFRINKGVLNIDSKSSEKLNEFTPENKRIIPFKNMIYIGDGITDVPCMKLVNVNGGSSIVVYDDDKNRKSAEDILKNNRANFMTKSDYSEGSDIENIVKLIIDKLRIVYELEKYSEKFK